MPHPEAASARIPQAPPSLAGLLGLAVLWHYHWSFHAQFDPAKISRISQGHAWIETLLEAVRYVLAPGEMAAVLAGVLCGHALRRLAEHPGGLPGRPSGRALLATRLIYPAYLACLLPLLSYTQAGWAETLPALAMIAPPPGLPRDCWFLLALVGSAVLLPALPSGLTQVRTLPARLSWAAFLLTCTAAPYGGFWASAAAGYLLAALPAPRRPAAGLLLAGFLFAGCLAPIPAPHRAGLALLAACALPRHLSCSSGLLARTLANPALTFYGRMALPFFLVHGLWGFRVSRSLLQGELHTPGAIVLHYTLSLTLATAGAWFFHAFFQRPALLRYEGANATNTASANQGARS